MRAKLIFIATVLLILSIAVAQDEAATCVVVLEQAVEVIGYSDQQEITLPVGTTIEYVGQEPDGSAWILRWNSEYFLYPTALPDLRPLPCEPSKWGPPPRQYLPLQTVMDEVGITSWHDQGYFGQGVRVGILDTRYDDLSKTLAGLPIAASQVTFIPSFSELETLLPQAERTEAHHGTNVLEVMSYIAPEAEYVLARSVDTDSFSQAVDDLIAENVQIIVHASNVITADPTPYHEAVRRANVAGILWVNAAGNIGAGYYPARYSGDDIVTVHQFNDPNRAGTQSSLMVPIDRNGSDQVTLIWDKPTDIPPNDFELVVYGSCNRRDETTFAALRADADQTSGAPSFESVPLSNGLLQQINDYTTIPATGTSLDCPDKAIPDGIKDNEIYVTVVDAAGNAQIDSRFDLYIEGALPAEFDPNISTSLDPVVLVPGDIAESFTVGAYDWHNNKIAWYSGRSNSLQYYELNNYDVDYSDDELVKPDIVTYGELLLPSGREFFGTSAATPVIGGTLAVLAKVVGSFDSSILKMTLMNNYAGCLSQGAVSRQIRYLMNSTSTTGNNNSLICNNYLWQNDLSSNLIPNFALPELVAAENIAEEQTGIAQSRQLASQAEVLIKKNDYETAVDVALQALENYAYTAEAERALASTLIAYHRHNTIATIDGAIGAVWSPDDTKLAVITDKGEIIIVDIQSRTASYLPVLAPNLYRVAWSTDSETIIYYTGTVERVLNDISEDDIYTDVNNLEIREIPIGNRDSSLVNESLYNFWLREKRISADTYNRTGSLFVFDLYELSDIPQIQRITESYDQSLVVLATRGGTVHVVDTLARQETAQFLPINGGSAPFIDAEISKNLSFLALVYPDAFSLFDLSSNSLIYQQNDPISNYQDVAWPSSGAYISIIESNGTISIWETESSLEVGKREYILQNEYTEDQLRQRESVTVLSPNGQYQLSVNASLQVGVATGTYPQGEGIARIRDVKTGEVILELELPGRLIFDVMWSEDGTSFITQDISRDITANNVTERIWSFWSDTDSLIDLTYRIKTDDLSFKQNPSTLNSQTQTAIADVSGDNLPVGDYLLLMNSYGSGEVGIRSRSNSSDEYITVLPGGSFAQIVDYTSDSSDSFIWYQVKIIPSGLTGWIEDFQVSHLTLNDGQDIDFNQICPDAGGFHFEITNVLLCRMVMARAAYLINQMRNHV